MTQTAHQTVHSKQHEVRKSIELTGSNDDARLTILPDLTQGTHSHLPSSPSSQLVTPHNTHTPTLHHLHHIIHPFVQVWTHTHTHTHTAEERETDDVQANFVYLG